MSLRRRVWCVLCVPLAYAMTAIFLAVYHYRQYRFRRVART